MSAFPPNYLSQEKEFLGKLTIWAGSSKGQSVVNMASSSKKKAQKELTVYSYSNKTNVQTYWGKGEIPNPLRLIQNEDAYTVGYPITVNAAKNQGVLLRISIKQLFSYKR
ncbi:hypothetical protein [Peribacillus glennii]|uniref:Uncharacterized protein n=1 Tax=Peribacillus glennii TaxID=2303991 RepID=A0A372L7U8_9BACI|nr:hypothetical protein [Peribacillus glennii]RFU60791.1 hypothetical protein D0466_20795 [Peribacillus glennii]